MAEQQGSEQALGVTSWGSSVAWNCGSFAAVELSKYNYVNIDSYSKTNGNSMFAGIQMAGDQHRTWTFEITMFQNYFNLFNNNINFILPHFTPTNVDVFFCWLKCHYSVVQCRANFKGLYLTKVSVEHIFLFLVITYDRFVRRHKF